MNPGLTSRQAHLTLAALCLGATVVTLYANSMDGVTDVLVEHARLFGWPRTDVPDSPAWLRTGLHASTTLALLLLTNQLLQQRAGPGPMVAAMSFALSPACVDAVASTLGRTEVTVALMTAVAVTLHRRGGVMGRAGAIVAFVLALPLHIGALCIPPILLVYDWLYRQRPTRSWIGSYAGLGTATVGSAALGLFEPSSLPTQLVQSAPALVAATSWVFPRVWMPVGLQAFDVCKPGLEACAASSAFSVAIVTVPLLAALRWWPGSCAKTVVFGWAMSMIGLLPAVSAVAIRGELEGRFAYLPAMGAAIIWASCVDAGFVWLRDALHGRWWWMLTGACVGVLWCALGLLSLQRVQAWRNAETLFQAELRNDPQDLLAHHALLHIHTRQGQHQQAAVHARQLQRV
ncbi:MAG: hypothetical protein ACOC1F_12910, partial [Myxococcota bacterium]